MATNSPALVHKTSEVVDVFSSGGDSPVHVAVVPQRHATAALISKADVDIVPPHHLESIEADFQVVQAVQNVWNDWNLLNDC